MGVCQVTKNGKVNNEVHRSHVHQISKAGPMEVNAVHEQVQRLACKVMAAGCMVVDQQCRESDRKAKITGYMAVLNEQAHHPNSTEIVTVLSHHVIGEWWSMESQAAGDEEDMVQEEAGNKLGSDQVSCRCGRLLMGNHGGNCLCLLGTVHLRYFCGLQYEWL